MYIHYQCALKQSRSDHQQVALESLRDLIAIGHLPLLRIFGILEVRRRASPDLELWAVRNAGGDRLAVMDWLLETLPTPGESYLIPKKKRLGEIQFEAMKLRHQAESADDDVTVKYAKAVIDSVHIALMN